VTDDDPGIVGGAPPRLTIGQRILAALPNLQREPAPAAPRAATSSRATRAARSDLEADVDGDSAGDVVDDDGGAPDDTEAVDDESPAAGARSAPVGIGGRLSALLNPSPPATRTRPVDELDTMTREEIAHRIKKLDDRERFLALTAAPIGVVVGILLTAFALHLNPAVRVHGKLNPKHVSDSLILLEGGVRIVLSGVVVLCALTRRRSLVGFSLLFLGTAMGSPLFALPFWVLGGYLIWRVFKYQKALTARGAAARNATRAGAAGGGRTGGTGRAGRAQVSTSPRAAGRAGAAAARERVQSRGRRGRKEPAPTGPTPSKRYTPPRPTRPRPPAPPS
jgi:hypothetical protein